MSAALRIALAFVAASFVAPIVFTAYAFATGASEARLILAIFATAWVVCAGHLLLLGLPIYWLLQRTAVLGWRPVAIAGFLAGAIPVGVFTWPLHGRLENYSSSGTWHGKYVSLVQNGVPTLHGWFSYLEGCVLFGVLGTLVAMVFWRTRVHLSATQPPSLASHGVDA